MGWLPNRLPAAKEQALAVTSGRLAIAAWDGTMAAAALVACGL
jgi:hypothetical protein